MGFYAKYVLPHLIDLAMKNKETAQLRSAWLPHARGEVLEVGIGSGLNLPFYSSKVRRVYGVDPSVELERMARKRLKDGQPEVEFLSQSAEDRLPPIWKRIGGGCHLNRHIGELIEAAGFHITELKTCYLRGPRPMTFTYQGVARVGGSSAFEISG